VGALVTSVRAQGTHSIALILPVEKEVTSHEGEGNFDPRYINEPTGDIDVSLPKSMSHAGGSGYSKDRMTHLEGGV
jgi:hypothetical protein